MRPAWGEPPAFSGELELYDAIPPESPVRVTAGEPYRFSVWVRGEGLRYQWLVDGGPVGDRHSWTFFPQETDLGSHLVTVAVDGPDGRATWTWHVHVELAGTVSTSSSSLPRLTTTSSRAVATTSTTEAPTATTSSTAKSTSTTTSTRETTSSTHLPTTSTTRLPTTTSTRRPTTTTSTTTSTRVPTTTSTRATTSSTSTTTSTRATTSSLPPTTTSTRAPTTTTSAAAPTTLVPTTGTRGTISEADIRALFERYKAAWRNHDIAGLESVGQISTQGQADALKQYFESVRDLEVDVTILNITFAGDEARVRFIRRDRFRDPAGNVVTKESPTVEKRIIPTPGGLRLSPLR